MMTIIELMIAFLLAYFYLQYGKIRWLWILRIYKFNSCPHWRVCGLFLSALEYFRSFYLVIMTTLIQFSKWSNDNFWSIQSCIFELFGISAVVGEIEDHFDPRALFTERFLMIGNSCFRSFIDKSVYSVIGRLSFRQAPDLWKSSVVHIQTSLQSSNGQRASQYIRTFTLKLQIKAVRYMFGDQLKSQLRDRLIVGINNQQLRQTLYLRHDPTLERVGEVWK